MKNTITFFLLGMMSSVFAHVSTDESFEEETKRKMDQCRQMKVAAEVLLYDPAFYDSSTIDEYLIKLEEDFQEDFGLENYQNLSTRDKASILSDDYLRCAHFVSNYLTALYAKEKFFIGRLHAIADHFQKIFNQTNSNDLDQTVKLLQLAIISSGLDKMLEFKEKWPSQDAFRMQINEYLRRIGVRVEWR